MPKKRAVGWTDPREITLADLPAKPLPLQATSKPALLKLLAMACDEFPAKLPEYLPWVPIFMSTNLGRGLCERWANMARESHLEPANLRTAPSVFLLLLKAEILLARLSDTLASLSPPRSLLWNKVLTEIDPVRRQELADQAAEEDQANRDAAFKALYSSGGDAQLEADAIECAGILGRAQSADLSDLTEQDRNRLDQILERFMKESLEIKKMESGQDRTPSLPQFRCWFDPMTTQEYVRATAVSRRTIKMFLQNHRPTNKRTSLSDPNVYGFETNMAVLGEWLTKWIRDDKTRLTCAAATLAKCAALEPERYREFASKLTKVAPALFELLTQKPRGDLFMADVLRITRFYRGRSE